TAAQQPLQYGSQLMGKTYVVSGSIRLFGQGVQRFNSVIDQLNEQYRQAQADDFGVAAAQYPDNADLTEKNAIDGARDEKIMNARVALLRTLVEQYKAALDAL